MTMLDLDSSVLWAAVTMESMDTRVDYPVGPTVRAMGSSG